MSTKMHSLKVKSVEKLTEDSVAVTFDVPDSLHDEFHYIPGQYLAVEAVINGEKVRRSYSLCSAPNEAKYTIAIKKVPEGKFSTYAVETLKAGDTVDVMSPTGNFQLKTSSDNANHYVGFAAGSGITPILSMIKSVLHEEPNSRFSLFYGNRNFDSIIFRDELEALKNVYLSRLSLHHVLSKEKLGSPLFFGRIDGEKCSKYAHRLFDPKQVAGFYLCGPSQMIFAVRDELEKQGSSKERIHFELFTTDDIKVEKKQEEITYNPETESRVTVILDGESFDMPLSYGGANILDTALAAGADLPYACKGGVCSTCKARITKGEVEMDINYALEPDEVERGFVLTCQAHPRTDHVTVNFDEA